MIHNLLVALKRFFEINMTLKSYISVSGHPNFHPSLPDAPYKHWLITHIKKYLNQKELIDFFQKNI